MATLLNAGDVKRTDLFLVNPVEILVKEEDRGRFEPPTEDQIIDLAVSIMDNGQLQPVTCRKIEGNRLKLTLGYTRMAAIRLIRDGFEHNGKTYHDPEYLIKVVLKSGNDEDAFVQNIVENCHRNATSPIDDAHNQNRLRERYGKSNVDIAGLYGCSTTQVGRLEKLLSLTRDQQMLVHSGALPLTAALDILDLPEDQRTEALASATNGNGKISGTKVRGVLRDHHLRDEGDKPTGAGGGNKPNKPTKTKCRSLGEIKTFLEEQANKHEGIAAEIADSMLAYVRGEITDAKMSEAFEALKTYANAA